MLQWGISFLNNRSGQNRMNIDSSNDLNHSDNEYILINTRSDQMEYDDEDLANVEYDPNIGMEPDEIEHDNYPNFANAAYDPNIGIG